MVQIPRPTNLKTKEVRTQAWLGKWGRRHQANTGHIPRDPLPGKRDVQTREDRLTSHPSVCWGSRRERDYSSLAPLPYPAVFLMKGFRRPPPFPNLSLCRISMKSESHFQSKVLGHKDNKDSFLMEGKYTVVSAAVGRHLLTVCNGHRTLPRASEMGTLVLTGWSWEARAQLGEIKVPYLQGQSPVLQPAPRGGR